MKFSESIKKREKKWRKKVVKNIIFPHDKKVIGYSYIEFCVRTNSLLAGTEKAIIVCTNSVLARTQNAVFPHYKKGVTGSIKNNFVTRYIDFCGIYKKDLTPHN